MFASLASSASIRSWLMLIGAGHTYMKWDGRGREHP